MGSLGFRFPPQGEGRDKHLPHRLRWGIGELFKIGNPLMALFYGDRKKILLEGGWGV